MSQDPERRAEQSRAASSVYRGLRILVVLGVLGYGAFQALTHPKTPLPPEWNPVLPLAVSDPISPITNWKLNRALATPEACLAVLVGSGVSGNFLTDREDSAQCFIRGRVNLTGVGLASIPEIETSCTIALRMAMWERHGLQPAAREILGVEISEIRQVGSYNCRSIRGSERISTHATAEAIDITGFRLSDGRVISLIEGWNGEADEAEFLRAARDSSCKWFRVTLGPDYNSLHADHFHLQHTGWGLCR